MRARVVHGSVALPKGMKDEVFATLIQQRSVAMTNTTITTSVDMGQELGHVERNSCSFLVSSFSLT